MVLGVNFGKQACMDACMVRCDYPCHTKPAHHRPIDPPTTRPQLACIWVKSSTEPRPPLPFRCAVEELVWDPEKSSSTSWLEYCRARELGGWFCCCFLVLAEGLSGLLSCW